MPNNAKLSQDLADDVLTFFLARKGFDWWWDDLEPEIQLEIQHDLRSDIEKTIRMSG